MKSRFRIYGVLLILCAVASCSRVPKHILSEKKFRSVLYDMLIAEAIVETQNINYRTDNEKQVVFDAVFAKHRITEAEYDSTLIWYGKNMDLYMAIYRLVLRDVNASIASLGEIKPNPLSGDFSARDSIDIWIFHRNSIIKPERAFNTLTFDIAPEIPYSSGSSYVFGLSIWGIPPGLKHKPKIHISAVQADTIISVNQEITGDGYYETVVRTVATKQILRVYGYILMNETEASYHRIYLNDIRLMKYNYDSKALTAPQDDESITE